MENIKGFYKNHKADILCLIGITMVFAVFALFMGRIYGDLYMDCGREAYIPELILKGKILYKDIFGMYNPLSYQINALAYVIFGSSWNTLYNLSYFNAWLMLIGLYIIARNFINEYYSSAIIIVLMSFYIFESKELISYIFPYSYSFPYAATCYTFSLVFFVKYIKNNLKSSLYIASLLMGLSLANRLEFILCILPMFVVMLHKKESVKNFLISILLTVAPTVISYGILFLQGLTFTDLSNYIKFIRDFFSTEEQRYYTSTFVKTSWSIENLSLCFSTFKQFILICFAGTIYFLYLKRNKYFFIAGLALIPLYIKLNLTFLSEYLLANLFSWVTIALIVILYFKSNKIETQKDYILIFLAATGLLSCSRINFLPIAKNGHAIYFLVPIIVCWIYFIITDFKLLKNINYKIYIAVTLIILSFTNIFYQKKLISESYIPVKTIKGSEYFRRDLVDVFDKTVKWIENHTEPNESVLVIPEGIMLNYVTERPTKPMYYHLVPNHINSLGEENVIKGLNADKPDYIILNDLIYQMYDKTFICKDFGFKICKYINKNYTLVETIEPNPGPESYFSAKIYKLK